MSDMETRKIDLYLRHIDEGGAKIAKYLATHPDINPDFIEDMTAKQQAELKQYSSDLAVTQQIEREQLDIEW